jgi:Fe-S cluster biogenesis protein NfuA
VHPGLPPVLVDVPTLGGWVIMRPRHIPRLLLLPLAGVLVSTGVAAPANAAPANAAPANAKALSAAPRTATYVTPRLVAVRAAHHTGFDRVVFQFTGAGPSSASVKYVKTLIADGSGDPIRVPARAILQVVMPGADAHDSAGQSTLPGQVAYAMPNVITTIRSGDYEAVVTYGIGLAAKTKVHTHWLNSPRRLVVDIATPFRTVTRKLYFADTKKIAANIDPPVTAVKRQVLATAPATGLMDRLYAGPTPAEMRRGLTLTTSHTTGYTKLRISAAKVARVQLRGACNGNGSAVITVATEIMPTLRQFASVRWVKIYDRYGHTEHPNGLSDSIPSCLEP